MASLWILIFITAPLFQGHLCYVSGPIAHLDMSLNSVGSLPESSLIASGSVGNQNSLAFGRTPVNSPGTAGSSLPDRASVPVNIPVNEPANIPANRPVSVPVNPTVNPPVTPPVNVPVNRPVNIPVNRPVNVPFNRPVSVPVNRPVNIPVNRPVSVPVNRPVDIQVNRPPNVPFNPPKKPFPAMTPVNPPKYSSSGTAVRFPNRPKPGLQYLPPPNPSQNRRPHADVHYQPISPPQQHQQQQQQQEQQQHHFFQDDYLNPLSNQLVFPPSVSYHHHTYHPTSHPGVFFSTENYPGHSIFKRQISRPQSGPFFNPGPPRPNGFNNNNGFGSPPGAGNWGNGNQNRPNFNQGQPQQPWWSNNGFNSNSEENEGPPFIFGGPTSPRPGRPNPVGRPRPQGRPSPVTQPPVTQPSVTQAPPPALTEEATVPTAGTTRRGCTCPTTPEFNPVCGDDRVTYFNAGRLRCSNQCGNRVSLVHGGACITSTSAAVTPPSLLNQRRSQG